MVDAACKAIKQATGIDGTLTDYTVTSVTGGVDALADVALRFEVDGLGMPGRGLSTDVVEASARAFLNAMNRIVRVQRLGRGPPLGRPPGLAQPALTHPAATGCRSHGPPSGAAGRIGVHSSPGRHVSGGDRRHRGRVQPPERPPRRGRVERLVRRRAPAGHGRGVGRWVVTRWEVADRPAGASRRWASPTSASTSSTTCGRADRAARPPRSVASRAGSPAAHHLGGRRAGVGLGLAGRLEPRASVTGQVIAYVGPNDRALDAEWNEWLSAMHIPDMLASGGFTDASRWVRTSRPGRSELPHDLRRRGHRRMEAVARSGAAMPRCTSRVGSWPATRAASARLRPPAAGAPRVRPS